MDPTYAHAICTCTKDDASKGMYTLGCPRHDVALDPAKLRQRQDENGNPIEEESAPEFDRFPAPESLSSIVLTMELDIANRQYVITTRYTPNQWCIERDSYRTYLESCTLRLDAPEDLTDLFIRDVIKVVEPLMASVTVVLRSRNGSSIVEVNAAAQAQATEQPKLRGVGGNSLVQTSRMPDGGKR